jgi:hypothetical protein
VSTMRIASPERPWRAAAALVIAGAIGWAVSVSVRLSVRPGTSPGLPASDRVVVIAVALAIGAALAVLIWRTHLTVSPEGLADHRLLRVIRIPWDLIVLFQVSRPSGPWGGYCIAAVCRDGKTIDLMSMRAYTRVPSARHLDELHRICWTLEEVARQRA